MSKNNGLYEDAVFAYAVNAVMQIQLNEWDNNPALNAEFMPSSKHKKMMKRIHAKVDRQVQWNSNYKPLKRIAACVIVSLALFTCVFAPVQAVQQAVITTVIEWYDKFTSFVYFSESVNNKTSLKDLRVEYWPDGYDTLVVDEKYDTLFSMAYMNKRGDIAYVKISNINENNLTAIDNEHSSFYPFEFDNKKAFLAVTNSRENILIWEDNGFSYHVICNESITELIKIAQSIEQLK